VSASTPSRNEADESRRAALTGGNWWYWDMMFADEVGVPLRGQRRSYMSCGEMLVSPGIGPDRRVTP
jgi:hypothetical protein